jgi:hypothetical protein
MSTAVATKPEVKSEVKMPVVRRGDVVIWYEGGVRNEERSAPAMVLKVQHNSLSLRVFGLENDLRFDCVKHMDDPYAREYERATEGGWDVRK